MTNVTLKTTPKQFGEILRKLSTENDSIQWQKRSLIATLAIKHDWKPGDLMKTKDATGAGYAFLHEACEGLSKTQFSETRSYSHPKVREHVDEIRSAAETLAKTESGAAGNIANLIVTQLKAGKSVKQAVKHVKKAKKDAKESAKKRRTDPEARKKANKAAAQQGLKKLFTDPSIAAFNVKLDEAFECLEPIAPKAESSDASEPQGVADLAAQLESLDPNLRTALAALLTK